MKELEKYRFTDVELSNELRADADGMPVFRRCFEHETLMSFNSDDGNYAFNNWWQQQGSILFGLWLDGHGGTSEK